MDFSEAILKDDKPAGLITRLNKDGEPAVKGTNDLRDLSSKIADVVNWAPTEDGLSFVTNSCTGKKFGVDTSQIKKFLPT